MILYATLGTSDLTRAIHFYDAVFATLGIGRAPNWDKGWAGWGGGYDEGPSLWISAPFDGKAPAPGNGPMLAFPAKDEKQVQAFHAAALAHAGSDEGAPGIRAAYGPNFYVAYVRDPDGNKLACVFHHYRPDQAGSINSR
jgi:catechol 2,3-dioxygenase-like lactoylglutathione lyase family enzyme